MRLRKKNINTTDNTILKLSHYYTGYRLLLALSFFLVLLITEHFTLITPVYSHFYLVVSGVYIIIAMINYLTLKFHPKRIHNQNFVYLLTDLIYLTFILFVGAGPNIAIILMYMVIVLAATMLLRTQYALALTLLSIIAVVYQQFFENVFRWNNSAFLGNSSLITLIFLSTYALGQLASKRFQVIEKLAIHQRAAFLELQQINQNIIEQLDTGFMVIDSQNKVISFNDAARNLLHLPTSSLHKNHHQLEKAYPYLDTELKKKISVHLKGIFHFFPTKHASDVVSIQYRPIATHQQQFILLIIESQQKLNQHVQQLKLASIGQLSASIAHEIRNPLAAISQANELLEEDIDPDLRALTQMINKQCKRINHTIDETLSMSKQNQTLPEDIHLYNWLKDFIKDDLIDIQKYLRLVIEDKLCIHFDPHQLRLVMINLIRNAIRHGHEHCPDSKVEIHAHYTAEFISIDVIDQGPGISEEQQGNLFEPFYSTSTAGTGLGLYLAKTFCEANHARLKYIPQPEGACFRIECLPAENK